MQSPVHEAPIADLLVVIVRVRRRFATGATGDQLTVYPADSALRPSGLGLPLPRTLIAKPSQMTIRFRAAFLRPWTLVRKKITVGKVTVSLDPAVAERACQDVAKGKAKSVSAWLNDAGRARADGEDLAVVLAELVDDTGGPLTEQELAQARQRLALAEQR